MPQPFDANFEGLLREAASAPRSMLLRVERPQVIPALRSREAPASVAMAGLSSVERELLASYRGELGFLLRQATLASLMHHSETGEWIDSSVDDAQVHHLPLQEEWCATATSHLTSPPTILPKSIQVGHEVLRRILSHGVTRTTTPQIAVAALRVEPFDQPRVYAGAHFAAIAQPTRSLEVLASVLDGHASVSNEAFARECGALALGRVGQYSDAAALIRASTQLGFPRAELPMRCLLYSALSDDRTAVNDAIRIVDDLVPSDHPAIERVCGAIRQQVARRAWSFTRVNWVALRELKRTPGTVSNRILNELTTQAMPTA
ncbi:MAG: hypothetical protein ABI054_01390 [Planctomycetota bacterium]